MERLVAILDPEQHLDRFALARRIDLDRLEPALERAVLLDVLAVLRRRRRADAADLAARQRRLEDVGGVERPFRRPRPDQRVELVDEHDDVRVLGQLLHDRLEALFELAAILRAGDDQGDVEGEDALVGEEVRDVAVDDLLRQPFDDGGLADARLADQHRVVLGAAAQHLLDPLELDVPPDQRIELRFHGRFGQVAAELREQRRFLDPGQGRLLVEQRDDVLPDGIQAHAFFHQDGGGHRPLFAQDPEQEVLGADVVVEQPIGLFRGELEDPLGFRAERDLDRRRNLLPEHRPPLDLLADAFERQVGTRENPARQSLPLADQTQQQVLGLDRYAAELTRLVTREEQHAPGPFRVAFEHPGYLLKMVDFHCRHYTAPPAECSRTTVAGGAYGYDGW